MYGAALALVRYYPKTVTAPRDESIKKKKKSFLQCGELLIVEINKDNDDDNGKR